MTRSVLSHHYSLGYSERIASIYNSPPLITQHPSPPLNSRQPGHTELDSAATTAGLVTIALYSTQCRAGANQIPKTGAIQPLEYRQQSRMSTGRCGPNRDAIVAMLSVHQLLDDVRNPLVISTLAHKRSVQHMRPTVDLNPR